MKLAIYGAGGLGREVYEIAMRRNAASKLWNDILFIDDFSEEGDYFGTQRVHFESLLSCKESYECIVAVGEPKSREVLYKKLVDHGMRLTKLVDTTAIISPTCKIDLGVIVCEFSTIHTDVEIGCNALIQPFCDIGHDIKVGSHSVLSPFCAPGGGTIFGDRVFVGMKSALMEGLVIGDDAIIAMGSVVFRDVPPLATVVGNPARITRGNDDHKVFKG